MARIILPDPAQAPALRASLEERADFRVTDLGGGQVEVVPAEGAGATPVFLRAHRLCDANTQITPQVWAPLAEHPAYEGNPASRARLLAEAARLAQIETPAAMLQAIEAAVAGFHNDELPGWLELQLPRLFELFPDGSLWLVSVEPVLSARLTILGSSFALQVTPDFPLDPNNVRGFDALDEHSLTRGISFGKALDPVLLAFSRPARSATPSTGSRTRSCSCLATTGAARGAAAVAELAIRADRVRAVWRGALGRSGLPRRRRLRGHRAALPVVGFAPQRLLQPRRRPDGLRRRRRRARPARPARVAPDVRADARRRDADPRRAAAGRASPADGGF